jgi:hypothetical protein
MPFDSSIIPQLTSFCSAACTHLLFGNPSGLATEESNLQSITTIFNVCVSKANPVNVMDFFNMTPMICRMS